MGSLPSWEGRWDPSSWWVSPAGPDNFLIMQKVPSFWPLPGLEAGARDPHRPLAGGGYREAPGPAQK